MFVAKKNTSIKSKVALSVKGKKLIVVKLFIGLFSFRFGNAIGVWWIDLFGNKGKKWKQQWNPQSYIKDLGKTKFKMQLFSQDVDMFFSCLRPKNSMLLLGEKEKNLSFVDMLVFDVLVLLCKNMQRKWLKNVIYINFGSELHSQKMRR